MLKLNSVIFFKALAMGTLLTTGGIGAEVDDKQSRDSTSSLTKYATSEGLDIETRRAIRETLERLDEIDQVRRNILRERRIIDLNSMHLDSVLGYLANAHIYSVKVRLTILNSTEDQRDRILNNENAGQIEELNWTYQPEQESLMEDPDEEETKGKSKKGKDDIDEDEDEKDSLKTKGWSRQIDSSSLDGYRLPRRAVARGRDALRFGDLDNNYGEKAKVIPIGELINLPANAPSLINSPDDNNKLITVNWRSTSIKKDQDNGNVLNLGTPNLSARQPQGYVHIFCKNQLSAVQAQ